jgi:xanthine dehydrogenase YagR molybdenum-binding subunit
MIRTSMRSALKVGEIGITGTAGAVANAVSHATGIRVRKFPITLDRLIEPQ